jgi:D-tyrosyl-tRNA(Tyr) deacylase
MCCSASTAPAAAGNCAANGIESRARPSFDGAAPGPLARALYEDVVRRLRESGLQVSTGIFQADMEVHLVNDGPVTLLLDSRKEF